MRLTNSADQYGAISKILHWLIAGLMIALIALGWWMVELSYYDPWYHDALLWHKTLGMCVMLLVAIKLIWRGITAMPQADVSLKPIERFGSHIVHHALFIAMAVLPISGYLVSASEGAAIEMFGGMNVPAVIVLGDQARDIAIAVHYYCAYGTLALVVLHAAAAFKHQFVDGTGILKRML